jgi:hypothetical protein
MKDRQEGLTKTYNRFHDPDETDRDIQQLRELHIEMDVAVAKAYGWEDLNLDHSFHDTKQGLRFTISEAARREILDRLLLLNHQRYQQEVEAGLHNKKKKPKKNIVKTEKTGENRNRKTPRRSIVFVLKEGNRGEEGNRQQATGNRQQERVDNRGE